MTIELRGVTIRYGKFVAVEGLTVTFAQGTVGLLGRNGAGKSSVLKTMLGLVRPSAGEVRVRGVDAGKDVDAIRRAVGYMPERDAHLPGTTGFEMVALLGMLSGMPPRDAWRRAHEVLYLVGLEEQRYRAVASYSAGMRQKVKLAAALVHDPDILFLDEPTNGLDPRDRHTMLELVHRLGSEFGKSVLLSTHLLQDVETICDAVVVLEAGRVVAQGGVEELTGRIGREFLLVVEPPSVRLPERVGAAVVADAGPGRYALRFEGGADTAPVLAAVVAAGGRVRSIEPRRRTLSEVFLAAVGGESDGRGP